MTQDIKNEWRCVVIPARFAFGLWLAVTLAAPTEAQAQDRWDYANPRPGESVETFYLEVSDFIAVTHGGELFMELVPEGITLFTEPAIKKSLALLMKVRDAEHTVIGFGVELETMDGGTTEEGLTIVNTDWIVVIPGRGTLYLFHQEDNRDLVNQIIKPVTESGEDWTGALDSVSTMGPRPDGRGVIKGGTGEFDSYSGAWVEIHHTTEYRADHHLESDVQLRLFLEPPSWNNGRRDDGETEE